MEIKKYMNRELIDDDEEPYRDSENNWKEDNLDMPD